MSADGNIEDCVVLRLRITDGTHTTFITVPREQWSMVDSRAALVQTIPEVETAEYYADGTRPVLRVRVPSVTNELVSRLHQSLQVDAISDWAIDQYAAALISLSAVVTWTMIEQAYENSYAHPDEPIDPIVLKFAQHVLSMPIYLAFSVVDKYAGEGASGMGRAWCALLPAYVAVRAYHNQHTITPAGREWLRSVWVRIETFSRYAHPAPYRESELEDVFHELWLPAEAKQDIVYRLSPQRPSCAVIGLRAWFVWEHSKMQAHLQTSTECYWHANSYNPPASKPEFNVPERRPRQIIVQELEYVD
jgi:hypothetical protein